VSSPKEGKSVQGGAIDFWVAEAIAQAKHEGINLTFSYVARFVANKLGYRVRPDDSGPKCSRPTRDGLVPGQPCKQRCTEPSRENCYGCQCAECGLHTCKPIGVK
jgi:hypothetical protein